jgi:transposase
MWLLAKRHIFNKRSLTMRRKNSTRQADRNVPGQKPRGCFQDRVKKVGPEHFAIIPVDCGKPEARLRVADFYGNILLKPFTAPISRAGLETACSCIRETLEKHRIADWVCVVESTGRYHRPVKQMLREQQWDIRDVHPYTTSLIRRSADLGSKTDDIDLAAIHRAAVNGLAMRPEVTDARDQEWRALSRHRRDLVEKAAAVKTQLQETIDGYLPGFTRLWGTVWESPIPATIATAFDSAQALGNASVEQFRQIAREAGSAIQKRTIDRIQAWSFQAAPADQSRRIHHLRACSLWQDLKSKWREIRDIELDLATFLCDSPAVLLLAFPGINVVSASDYGAELGPIQNYAKSKSIAGRAGLYPSRYQSCQTDHANGPLVARRNRQLRGALVRIAYNLECCNVYFKGVAHEYAQRKPKRNANVPIARIFSRLSYYILASSELTGHSALQSRDKILQKLLEFFGEHDADPSRTTTAINQVIRRLSPDTLRVEREAFQTQSRKVQQAPRRTRGLLRLGEILPAVLLRIDEQLHKESTTEQIEPKHNPMNQDVTHGS